MTQQREEEVPLKNISTGEVGYSFGCTEAGKTVQVRLQNGTLDSWSADDCMEL
jgi:hypothetical protein